MSPLSVDVLIPTYNPKPEHLSEALRSLQAQTFRDWTALIHDDCSTTDVAAIVAPFLSDTRIRFVRSDTRLGIGGNWNACFRQSSAELIAYLFQDDVWAPTYIADAIETMEKNPTIGFVSMEHAYAIEGEMTTAPLYDAVREFRDKHVKSGLHSGLALLKWWIEQELTPNIIGEPSFVVIRRDALQKMGPFLNDMPQFLDVEYWTRLLLRYDWFFKRGKYGSFRVHIKGASAVNQESGQGLFDRLRCFEILIATLAPNDKPTAIRARSKALKTMVTKFRNRVGSGKKVSAQGSGELKKFCMHHPFLILKAIIASYISGK
jgi:glycosyltransferase involved in cell wall biosynthesis